MSFSRFEPKDLNAEITTNGAGPWPSGTAPVRAMVYPADVEGRIAEINRKQFQVVTSTDVVSVIYVLGEGSRYDKLWSALETAASEVKSRVNAFLSILDVAKFVEGSVNFADARMTALLDALVADRVFTSADKEALVKVTAPFGVGTKTFARAEELWGDGFVIDNRLYWDAFRGVS